MGRSSIDLYSNDVGAPLQKSRVLPPVAAHPPISAWVWRQTKDGVSLRVWVLTLWVTLSSTFSRRKEWIPNLVCVNLADAAAPVWALSHPTNSRSFTADNCAGIELTIDDVLASPTADSAFQFAGTNLSKEPSRSATISLVQNWRAVGTEVFDVDFRPDQ